MFEALPFSQIVISVIIILVAYLIRGLAGFGSGLIAIPLLAFMLPLPVVVPMIVLLDYLASTSHGITQRDLIRTGEILPLLPFSIVGTLIALYLFKSVDTTLLNKILGGFIILYAIYTLANVTPSRVRSRMVAVPTGILGGSIGTLFGTGGPFYVIYLKLRGLDKSEFRATFAAIFLLDGLVRLIGYLIGGFFSLDSLILVAVAFPVMFIGMYIGGHVHTNISHDTFQRAISLLLVISGTALLIK